MILRHLRGQRSAPGLEVGNQLLQGSRIQHGTRQQVGARLRSFLDDRYAEGLTRSLLQLSESQRRGETCRTAADDQHVDVQRLALAHLSCSNSTQSRRDAGNFFLKAKSAPRLRVSASK